MVFLCSAGWSQTQGLSDPLVAASWLVCTPPLSCSGVCNTQSSSSRPFGLRTSFYWEWLRMSRSPCIYGMGLSLLNAIGTTMEVCLKHSLTWELSIQCPPALRSLENSTVDMKNRWKKSGEGGLSPALKQFDLLVPWEGSCSFLPSDHNLGIATLEKWSFGNKHL